MIPKVFREVIDLGDGREISIETGKLAKQAHGSVVVQSGKCMLLCTVVSNYKQQKSMPKLQESELVVLNKTILD